MKNNFPNKIPVFPLKGVIFFPGTNLPLNIFESRYLEMVEDSLKSQKLIGMIQSKELDGSVFKIGCLGRINTHTKTKDGRILINLLGLTRFEIVNESKNNKLYREFEVNYKEFYEDEKISNSLLKEDLLENLINNCKRLFQKQGILINWSELSKLKKYQQVCTLAMICPISVGEKQKLLEVVHLKEIAETLNEIIKFNFYQDYDDKNLIQ